MNEINKIERNVLDAYFSTRVNNAPPPSQSNLFVTDNKTTLEIVEALDSTYPLTQQDVVSYMTEHGYIWKSHTNLTHPGKYFRPSKVKIMKPTSPK